MYPPLSLLAKVRLEIPACEVCLRSSRRRPIPAFERPCHLLQLAACPSRPARARETQRGRSAPHAGICFAVQKRQCPSRALEPIKCQHLAHLAAHLARWTVDFACGTTCDVRARPNDVGPSAPASGMSLLSNAPRYGRDRAPHRKKKFGVCLWCVRVLLFRGSALPRVTIPRVGNSSSAPTTLSPRALLLLSHAVPR